MTLETIKIKSDSSVGYAFINEEDFDESVHELFDAPEAVDAPKVKVAKVKRELQNDDGN